MSHTPTDTDTLVARLRDADRGYEPGTMFTTAADRIEALEAEVARRSEMHECAMAERDDCILDWSNTKAERDRLAEEVERLTDALASHDKRKEGR